MPGHTGGHAGKGFGSGFGGSSKGSTKGGKKEGKSFGDRLREKQKQNQAKRAQLQRNLDKIKSGTAVKGGKGFLRDTRGNIVSYSGGATKAREDAKKRAAELAQKELAKKGITANPDMARRMMEAERQTLLDRAKQNQITGVGLDRLGGLNRMFGANPTTGMGLGESLRFQGRGLAQDLPGLAKAAGFVANPLGSIATGLLTGGEGIASLAGNILGGLKTRGQNVLADLKDEDIVGYTDQGTPVRVGQNITETDGPGFFEGIASKLKLGEGAPFVEDRGRGGEQRGLAALQQPMQTGPSLMTQPIQNLPITTQPVDANIMNQYLALAGFSPQEIQGMPSAFRFLG